MRAIWASSRSDRIIVQIGRLMPLNLTRSDAEQLRDALADALAISAEGEQT